MNFSWTRKFYHTNIFNSFALMSVPFHVPLIYWRAWCMIMHIYVFCLNCIMVELSDNHTHTQIHLCLIFMDYYIFFIWIFSFHLPWVNCSFFPLPFIFKIFSFLLLLLLHCKLYMIHLVHVHCTYMLNENYTLCVSLKMRSHSYHHRPYYHIIIIICCRFCGWSPAWQLRDTSRHSPFSHTINDVAFLYSEYKFSYILWYFYYYHYCSMKLCEQ